jgi:gamma-glutamylcyclotransferase (GGCT)/AIG2-like uncharacterized protein YtfP
VHLFGYGSLIFPEVLRAVTGLSMRPEPAILRGYARYLVQGETYPGIVPDPSASTDGALYTGLDGDAISRLDRFEGDFYERISVPVEGTSSGLVQACTYVFRPSQGRPLTGLPWSRTEFRDRHLARFLSSYEGFLWMDGPSGAGTADATPT